MAVTLQATFSKESKEFDGLGAFSDELIADPYKRRFIISEVEVTDMNVDFKNGGVKTPKVRIVSTEVMTGDDEDTVRKMRDAAYHDRTGQVAPPATLFDDGIPMDDPDDDPDGE